MIPVVDGCRLCERHPRPTSGDRNNRRRLVAKKVKDYARRPGKYWSRSAGVSGENDRRSERSLHPSALLRKEVEA
jgi:hypothetical protein